MNATKFFITFVVITLTCYTPLGFSAPKFKRYQVLIDTGYSFNQDIHLAYGTTSSLSAQENETLLDEKAKGFQYGIHFSVYTTPNLRLSLAAAFATVKARESSDISATEPIHGIDTMDEEANIRTTLDNKFFYGALDFVMLLEDEWEWFLGSHIGWMHTEITTLEVNNNDVTLEPDQKKSFGGIAYGLQTGLQFNFSTFIFSSAIKGTRLYSAHKWKFSQNETYAYYTEMQDVLSIEFSLGIRF